MDEAKLVRPVQHGNNGFIVARKQANTLLRVLVYDYFKFLSNFRQKYYKTCVISFKGIGVRSIIELR